MRILHLTSHLNVGGVARYTVSAAQALSRRGHQVIIASGGGELEPEAAAAGVPHWRVPLHTSAEFSPQVFAAARQMSRRLRQEPVELLHAHTRVSQVVAARLSRALRIPYVTTWHGIFRPNLGRRLWPCTGDLTVAISEPVRQHLRTAFRVPDSRIRLIPNGVDPAHFAETPDAAVVAQYRERHQLPDGQPVIGTVGRLASGGIKGLDLLLGAAHALRQEQPNLHILIVGEGPRRPLLERLVRDLGLAAHVRFAGAAADVRVPLAVMQVFAFPVRWQEGFGLALIEAMAAGKPIVATRAGAVPDIVEDGRSGLLVSPEDPASLAQGIARLLRDPAAASRMGREAQARVREAFSLEQMIERLEAVYRELADGKRQGA
ncbi:MAG: glycosyltransferase family 4 protein [Candidatus Omnitrophica bacterium]|nr:glycosyltransferase family 4 protein [Candidatus Omnitrophota bacterium]